jgi:hypothetical protein
MTPLYRIRSSVGGARREIAGEADVAASGGYALRGRLRYGLRGTGSFHGDVSHSRDILGGGSRYAEREGIVRTSVGMGALAFFADEFLTAGAGGHLDRLRDEATSRKVNAATGEVSIRAGRPGGLSATVRAAGAIYTGTTEGRRLELSPEVSVPLGSHLRATVRYDLVVDSQASPDTTHGTRGGIGLSF